MATICGMRSREIGEELAQIAQHRREREEEEERQQQADAEDHQRDAKAARGVPATDLDPADRVGDRRQHDREQGADVENLQLSCELPGKPERDQNHKEEDDVAAADGGGWNVASVGWLGWSSLLASLLSTSLIASRFLGLRS